MMLTTDCYGSLNLTEASPVQSWTEPLTVEEVLTHLKMPESVLDDLTAAGELEAMIVGAREQAEILQNRDLVEKQWDLSYDAFPPWKIELRDPLVSVDLVKYRDSDGDYTTLTEDTDYIVDASKHPGVLLPAYNCSWPTFTSWPSSAVLIRFSSGFASDSLWWSDAGARVKVGMKMLIALWYLKRLPFVRSAEAVAEYPFTLTACLSYGALERVR